jgi:hypothetical protein
MLNIIEAMDGFNIKLAVGRIQGDGKDMPKGFGEAISAL